MLRRHCRIAAFNLRRIYYFINSVAYAQAAQAYTRLSWTPYRDSGVLNALYTVMFWKGSPGTVEAVQNVRLIEARRRELMCHYWTISLGRLQCGPQSFVHYLESLDEVKQYSVNALRNTYRNANETNREIAERTQTAIQWLARAKLASTTFIALSSGGLSVAGSAAAVYASGVAAGYSVIGTFAKDLASAKQADVLAMDISKEAIKVAGTEKTEEIGKQAAETLQKNVATRLVQEQSLIANAESQIQELSRQIARKTGTSKLAKLGRQLDRAETERAAAQSAAVNTQRLGQFAHVAGKVLPVVFAAHDIFEAFEEYQTDIGASKPEKR